MADLQKTIEILFGGTDNLSPITRNMTRTIGDFDSSLQSSVSVVNGYTSTIIKTEMAVLALGVTMTAVAINEAGNFHESIEEIGTLFNGTVEETKQLENAILDFSKTSGASIEDINNATYIAISTGAEWASVTETLAAAEVLATAGRIDLADATAVLQRSMNAYGFEASKATEVSEALFTTVQNGDITMALLSENLGKVATDAKAAGVPFDDLLASVSAMTIAGKDTSSSMTGLKSLFKELASPSTELSTAMGGMTLETNTLQEMMIKLKESTGGSKQAFDELFPNVNASTAALVLANDTAGSFAKTLDAMANKSGLLAEANKRMADEYASVNQYLVNSIRATLIDVGLPLLDDYTQGMTALTGVFSGLDKGIKSPNFDIIYNAIESFVDNFSGKMDEIAGALPDAMAQIDFTDLVGAFDDVTDTLGDAFDSVFGAGLDLTKPDDLATALQSGVNILKTFVDLTTGIITGLQPVFAILGKMATETGEVSESSAKATGEVLGSIALLGEFGTALGAALIVMREAKADVTNVFAGLSGTTTVIINAVQVFFDTFALHLVNLAIKANETLASITFGETSANFQSEADELKLVADGINANLVKNAGEMVGGYNTAMSGFDGSAALKNDADKTKETAEKFKGDLDKASKDITREWNSQEFNANNAMQLDVIDIENTTNGLAETIAEDATDIEDVWQIDPNMTSSFEEEATNINNVVEGIDGALSNQVENIEGTWNDFGDNLSPNIFDDAVNGVTDSFGDADQAVEDYTKTMVDGVATCSNVDKAIEKTSKKLEESKESTEKAQIAFAGLAVDMEKIASNERIVSMELKVEIDVAKIEADTKKTVAAMEAVAESYTATEGTISSMWETLSGDGLNRLNEIDLERQIDAQEERAQDQWETQKKLTEAQIEQMTASTERMNNGDALIQVDGGDLQPELESIMQSLLKSIRITASASFQDYILGIQAPPQEPI